MKYAALFILVLIICIIPVTAQQPWCEINRIWFQHNESPDITGYETWINYPSGGQEIIENVSIRNIDGYTKIDTYISPPGEPAAYSILKGLRTYHGFFYVSTNVGITKVRYEPFVKKANGTEVILYQLDTADINDLAVKEIITNYASTVDLGIDPTDRLGVNVYAVTDHSSNVVVNFVYQGIDHASYVDSGYFDCTAPITPTIPNLPAAEPDPLGILIGYIPLAIIVAGILIFVRVAW
jgi:hypothetical protein